ncbi:MAG: hypothetical protein SangKO_025270 [Sandaracinaceae bacterium]
MDKLLALRLATMASAWAEQQKDPKAGALDFDERFGLLVDAEYLARDNRKVTRLLKAAKLRLSSASMEDVKTSSKKGLDRGTCNQLASCRWIGEHLNVLVSGATGVGKSYLACAMGQAACRRATGSSTTACPGSSRSSPSPKPTAPTRNSWPGSRRPTSS